MLGDNYLKISEIFTLRSSIDAYLRHATSPAGINFLDLLNLIPMIRVKRKAETVKGKSIYLCSHFSQWTFQEHGELSKVIAMFWYEMQFNKILDQRKKSIKTFLLFQNSLAGPPSAANSVSRCSRMLNPLKILSKSVRQWSVSLHYLHSWGYKWSIWRILIVTLTFTLSYRYNVS